MTRPIMWVELIATLICAALVGLALGTGGVLASAQIAYVSESAEGSGDIFLMDIDHNLTHNLTRNRAHDLDPEWSPDGNRLAFSSNRNGGNFAIYILNLLNGELEQVTATIGYNVFNLGWSPDGQQILIQLYPLESGITDVCAMDVISKLVDCIPNVAALVWSPDGKQLAFLRSVYSIGVVLYVSDADGGNARQLTGNVGSLTGRLSWSPDGQQIAYSLGGDLYVINADGSNQQLFIDYGGGEYNLTWSSDHRSIVFQSDRDGNEEIYIMEIASAQIRRLTDNHTVDHSPAWRP